jgi:hypothetical protein
MATAGTLKLADTVAGPFMVTVDPETGPEKLENT